MKTKDNIEYLKTLKETGGPSIISGAMLWFRIPYNLWKGYSLQKCLRQENIDLWNVGLNYRIHLHELDHIKSQRELRKIKG